MTRAVIGQRLLKVFCWHVSCYSLCERNVLIIKHLHARPAHPRNPLGRNVLGVFHVARGHEARLVKPRVVLGEQGGVVLGESLALGWVLNAGDEFGGCDEVLACLHRVSMGLGGYVVKGYLNPTLPLTSALVACSALASH